MKKDLRYKKPPNFKSKCTICMLLKKYYNCRYDINFLIIIDNMVDINKKFINIINSFNIEHGYVSIINDAKLLHGMEITSGIYVYILPATEKGLKMIKKINKYVISLSKINTILDIIKEYNDDKEIFNNIINTLDNNDIIDISQSDYNNTIEYMMRNGFHNYDYDSFLKFINLCNINNEES